MQNLCQKLALSCIILAHSGRLNKFLKTLQLIMEANCRNVPAIMVMCVLFRLHVYSLPTTRV